ncbi:fatty acid desaturase [Parvibaculum sp.]|uniref:fatty acid desaturase n=1 Tax=Parvibaculum sp. TaxID=2024848 RepID=UPI00320DA4B9
MTAQDERAAPRLDAGRLARLLNHYRDANTGRGIFELAVTAVPFVIAWGLMALAFYRGYIWLYALLMLPAAGFLVRLFLIQHDCGHGAFLPNRAGNDWVGRIISVLTLTPYDHWKRSHAIHHATAGNLDRRGIGDVDTLTVEEYLARSRWGRLRYRFYRHPIVMFGIGPMYLFLVQSRVPTGFMSKGWRPWASAMSTNIAIAVAAGLMIWAVGFWPFILIQLPVVLLGATAGVWLFFIQHQFEETQWSKGDSWHMQDAALHGSSYYVLPPVLRWFSANIGVHHVHHLSSRIPYYRLPEVLRDHPELRGVGRVTLLQSFKCVSLALWDEKRRQLISFRDLRREYSAA